MFVQTSPRNKNGRITMYYAESYRENGRVKQRTIEKIGFVDEFDGTEDEVIKHFKKLAKEKTKQLKEENKPIIITFEPNEILPFEETTESYDCLKNIGYVTLSNIFHNLGIHTFFNRKSQPLDLSYNLTSVMKLLVYGRIINPDSKRATWFTKNMYFDKMDFDLNAIYRSLSYIAKWKEPLMKHLHKQMVKQYNRDTTVLFYDVTNYYFEIDNEDNFRRKGVSKEHRPLPIVQMGLFMDEKGFPVTYELFPGNTNDCKTFAPMSAQVREQIDVKHIIFVADKGMMSGMNVADVITNHNGYIFSKSVKGGTENLKNVVKDLTGYVKLDASSKVIDYDKYESIEDAPPVAFMYKIYDEVKDTYVENTEGKKKNVKGVGHYQIIFWSAKYAQRAKQDRLAAVEKALVASHSNSKDVIDNNHGKNKYLKTKVIDPETEKEIKNYKAKVVFDNQQLDEEESLDGFYVIETNVVGLLPILDANGKETGEYQKPFNKPQRWLKKEGWLQLNKIIGPLDIIDMYHGLWKIEQTFRVTKSELNARPIYVKREDRIQAHFLTCFISLLITRILEHDLDYEYSTEQIQNSLKKANVVELNSTTFKLTYYDRILQKIKNKYGIEYGQNIYTRNQIKKMIAKTKK
ncbi:MAG: IS1634 family transposase [Pleomorphochaeta sp.]